MNRWLHSDTGVWRRVGKGPRSPAECSWVIMAIGFLCSSVCLQVRIMGRGAGARSAEPSRKWAGVKGNWGAVDLALILAPKDSNPWAPHHFYHPWVLLITTLKHITDLNIFLKEQFIPSFLLFSSTAFICLIGHALALPRSPLFLISNER